MDMVSVLNSPERLKKISDLKCYLKCVHVNGQLISYFEFSEPISMTPEDVLMLGKVIENMVTQLNRKKTDRILIRAMEATALSWVKDNLLSTQSLFANEVPEDSENHILKSDEVCMVEPLNNGGGNLLKVKMEKN